MKEIGQALKKQGQKRAAKRAGDRWLADCMHALQVYVETHGTAFPIEAFRAWAVPRVIDPPPSHKVWGSLPRRAIAAGIIEPVLDVNGKPMYWKATSPQTHAHPVRIYRRAPR